MSRGVGVTEFLTGALPAWALPVVMVATMLAEAPILVSLVAFRFWFRDRHDGLRLVAIATTALAVLLAAKYTFDLARPAAAVRVPVSDVVPPFDAIYLDLLDTDEPGFPSGHTTLAAAVYGGAALDATDRRRWLGVAAVLTVLVGFSRVFLGVHYLTDVAGGVVLGAGIVLAMRAADDRYGAPTGALGLGVGATAIALLVAPLGQDIVAAAGALAGAAALWVVVDVPTDPWTSSREAAVSGGAAIGITALAGVAYLALDGGLAASFVVAGVGTAAVVAVTGVDLPGQ